MDGDNTKFTNVNLPGLSKIFAFYNPGMGGGSLAATL
jgi:hypothetical protein